MADRGGRQIIRFIKKLAIFVVLLFVVDVVMGRFIETVFYLQPSGKYARLTRAIKNTTADIVIFGSSHAHRHYVPSILEAATGLECYNAGTKGQRMIFNLSLQEVIFKHHVPKITLLNVDPRFLYKDEKEYEKLADLLPYYRKNHGLLKVLSLRGPFEKYKLLSHLYPYNSTLVHIVYFYLEPKKDFSGYRPLIGNLKPQGSVRQVRNIDPEGNEDIEITSGFKEIDLKCIEALERFIANCTRYGSKLILIVSPNFAGNAYDNDPSFNKIKEIVSRYNVPFLNYADHPLFSLKRKYFHDFQHMNKTGAEQFSRMVSKQLVSLTGLTVQKGNGRLRTTQTHKGQANRIGLPDESM